MMCPLQLALRTISPTTMHACSHLRLSPSLPQPLQKQPAVLAAAAAVQSNASQSQVQASSSPPPAPSSKQTQTMPQKHSRNNTDRAAFTYQEKQMVG